MVPEAIVSPWVDFWCVGGLSVLLMIGITAYILSQQLTVGYIEGDINVIDLFLFQLLLNWPHFVISYKILYSKKDNFKKYPMATTYVPVVLLSICLLSFLFVDENNLPSFAVHQQTAHYFWLLAAFYLAWHYTGQAWGMIAVFTNIANIKFLDWEAKALRLSTKSMIIWHVVWGIQGVDVGSELAFLRLDWAMPTINTMAFVTFCLGLYTFLNIYKRVGYIEARMMIPWLALYLWYLVLYLDPSSFMLVQLSHCLQYMIFPVRVEVNTLVTSQKKSQSVTFKQWFKGIRLYVVTVILGAVIFYFPELWMSNSKGLASIATMLALAVNIHHYYTDSAIWKIRDKAVFNMLFAHIKGR